MVNNRAYDNDLGRQHHIARVRGRPRQRARVGVMIDDPAPDFAGLARAFGWYADGPVSLRNGSGTRSVLPPRLSPRRANALVDVVCQADNSS